MSSVKVERVRARLVNIKRGPLDDGEIDRIVELAGKMKKPTSGAIARRLNRHPATVFWQMMKLGLCKKPIDYRRTDYMRGGTLVRVFDREEDALMLSLRKAGTGLTDIAAALNARFGRGRDGHAINVRLAMHAAREED